MKNSKSHLTIFLLLLTISTSNIFCQNSTMSSLIEQKEEILKETEWNYLLLKDYNIIVSEYSSKGLVSYIDLVNNSNMEKRSYQIFITPYTSTKGNWISKSYTYQLIDGEFEEYQKQKLDEINSQIENLEVRLRKIKENNRLLEIEKKEKLEIKKSKLDRFKDSVQVILEENIQIERFRFQKYNRAYNQLKPLIETDEGYGFLNFVPFLKSVIWKLDDFDDENYEPYISFIENTLSSEEDKSTPYLSIRQPKIELNNWYKATLKQIESNPIDYDLNESFTEKDFGYLVDVSSKMKLDEYPRSKWLENSESYDNLINQYSNAFGKPSFQSDDLIQMFYDQYSKVVKDIKEYIKVSDWIKTKIIPLVFKGDPNYGSAGRLKKGVFNKIDKCLKSELHPLDYKFVMKVLSSNASLDGSLDFEIDRETNTYDFYLTKYDYPKDWISFVREFKKENPDFIETNLDIELSCF